jgi:hypothetical protein
LSATRGGGDQLGVGGGEVALIGAARGHREFAISSWGMASFAIVRFVGGKAVSIVRHERSEGDLSVPA